MKACFLSFYSKARVLCFINYINNQLTPNCKAMLVIIVSLVVINILVLAGKLSESKQRI